MRKRRVKFTEQFLDSVKKKSQSKKRQKLPRIISNSVQTQKGNKSNETKELIDIKNRLEAIRHDLKGCVGSEYVMRYKCLKLREEKLLKHMKLVKDGIYDKKVEEDSNILKKVEHLNRQIESNKSSEIVRKIQVENRLLPTTTTQRNIFENMNEREIERFKLQRSHKKRQEIITGQLSNPRTNSIDRCERCNVQRIFDKETSRIICPSCAETKSMASHIFETKVEMKTSAPNQSINHMQKFINQYQKGNPVTPVSILEKMSVEYNKKFHTNDPHKAQPRNTTQILNENTTIPKKFKRFAEKMNRELRNESIPEFTREEIDVIIKQRSQLRSKKDDVKPNETPLIPKTDSEQNAHKNTTDTQKNTKSFSNNIYVRQLALANNMAMGRLFKQARTSRIHNSRMKKVEEECMCLNQDNNELQTKLSGGKKKTGDNSNICLYPSS